MTTGSARPLCVGVGGSSGSWSRSGSGGGALAGMAPGGGVRFSTRPPNGLKSSASSGPGSGSGLGFGKPADRRGLVASAPLSLDAGIRRAGEPRFWESTAVVPDMLLLGRAAPLSRNRSVRPPAWAADPSAASSCPGCVEGLLSTALDGLRLLLRLCRISGFVRARLDFVGDAKEGLRGFAARGGGGSGGVVDSLLLPSSSRWLLRRGETLRRLGADSSIFGARRKAYGSISTPVCDLARCSSAMGNDSGAVLVLQL